METFSFIINTIISEDLWFYFNSAMAQSLAALIAIVGMFTIFRIELSNNRLNRAADALKNKFKQPQALDKDAFMYPSFLLDNEGRKDSGMRDYRIEEHNTIDMHDLIYSKFPAPLKALFFLLILYASALAATHLFTSNIYGKLTGCVFIIYMLVKTTWTLIDLYRFIWAALSVQPSVIVNFPEIPNVPDYIRTDASIDHVKIYEYIGFLENEVVNFSDKSLTLISSNLSLQDAVNARKKRMNDIKALVESKNIKLMDSGYYEEADDNLSEEIIKRENQNLAVIYRFIGKRFKIDNEKIVIDLYNTYRKNT